MKLTLGLSVQFYQKRKVSNMKNRLKNYGLWISVASFAFMVLQNTGVQITPESWDLYVNSILGIFILLGIVNNPTTDNPGFGDDKE